MAFEKQSIKRIPMLQLYYIRDTGETNING